VLTACPQEFLNAPWNNSEHNFDAAATAAHRSFTANHRHRDRGAGQRQLLVSGESKSPELRDEYLRLSGVVNPIQIASQHHQLGQVADARIDTAARSVIRPRSWLAGEFFLTFLLLNS